MNLKMIGVAASIAASTVAAAPASAVMLVQYYTVQANGRDFQGPVPNSVVTNGVESTLSNGRPQVTSANPLMAVDVNANRELQWWTPQATSTLNVVATGSELFASNNFSDTSFYPSNGNGASNANGFQTAIFSGLFSLLSAQSVDFSIGSDDDAFLFVDGISRVQNGGIHGNNVTSNTVSLGAGVHSFQLFYADRRQTGAELTFRLPANIVITPPAVPEPASWAMMIFGMGMIGGALRRRKSKVTTNIAYA